MEKPSNIVFGSTGLIGRKLVEKLSENENINTTAIVRKSVHYFPKNIKVVKVKYSDLLSSKEILSCDHVFICLGTTIKLAGGKKEFKKIDLDYCTSIAELALTGGAKQVSLVSSVGADENSNNFYLKIKGKLIKNIIQMKYETINIYQPGLLIGKRKEKRFLESIGQNISFLIDPLLMGKMSKYRSIKADYIALHMTKPKKKGINYFHYRDIIDGL